MTRIQDKNPITSDWDAAEKVMTSIRASKKPGKRGNFATSADMGKPRDVTSVFVPGGYCEAHASNTSGRYKNWVWYYKDGLLCAKGENTAHNAEIRAIASTIL